MCNSVNHTRFPKEDHVPDCVCRDKHGNININIPYFSIDNAHLMYNAHPKFLLYTSTLVLLLYLNYLSYLSNVYRASSFFTNLDLFCIDNARVIY